MSMDDFRYAIKRDHALRNPPDGPVTILDEAHYIPARVRASTGRVIAYTPTHGLHEAVFHGERIIRWEPGWQIRRVGRA